MKLRRRTSDDERRQAEYLDRNWDAAKLSMQEFGNWIKNADAKVSLLGASFGVSVSVIGTKSETFRYALQNEGFGYEPILLILLTLTGVTLLACAFCIYKCLVPRTKTGPQNLFSWASVSANEVAPASASSQRLLDDAWSQCAELAGIARAKYFWLKLALPAFGLFLSFSAIAFVLALTAPGQ